jgi:HD-like signal output (HDOD) protein
LTAFIPVERVCDQYRIPPLSSALVKLLTLSGEQRQDLRLLELIAAKDPAAQARLLALANSAFYGGRRRASTLAEALQTLGARLAYDALLAIWMSGLLAPQARYAQASAHLVKHMFSLSATVRNLRLTAGMIPAIEDSDLSLCTILDRLPLVALLVPQNAGEAQARLLELCAAHSSLFYAEQQLWPMFVRAADYALAWGCSPEVVRALRCARAFACEHAKEECEAQPGVTLREAIALAEALLQARSASRGFERLDESNPLVARGAAFVRFRGLEPLSLAISF